MTKKILSPSECFSSKIIPVVNLSSIEQAKRILPLLVDAGIDVIELTLRNESALDVINWCSENQKEICIGVGTVCHPRDLEKVLAAGAHFAVSPGQTQELLVKAKQLKIPYWPGVMTPSDILLVQQAGYQEVKFFPAQQAGGIKLLNAFNGPFSDMSFCATGGITQDNAEDYLALNNVSCVGSSGLISNDDIQQGNWQAIHEKCQWAKNINIQSI